MSADDILRLHYQERQFLGARDFDDEQAYLLESRRRNNVSGRSWGILSGLLIRSIDGGPWLVTAGAMIDAYGRETYVFEDTALDVVEIASKYTTATTIKVWLSYATEETSPAAAGYLTCSDGAMNTRTRESFRLIYQDKPVPFDSKLPDDSSLWPVATQDLPDDPLDAAWPVLLGTITWDGTAITSATDTDRRYSGLRGAEVLSQTAQFDVHPGQLRLFVDSADGAVLTTMKGSLSSGDVNLHLRTNGSSGLGSIVVDMDDVDLKKKLSVAQPATFLETVGNGKGKLLLEVDSASNVATLTRKNGFGSAHDIAIATAEGAGGNSVRINQDKLVMRNVVAEGGAVFQQGLESWGGAVFRNGLDSWDKIILKTTTGSDDSDPMTISRAQPTNTTNVNDLRVQIGDDLDGNDRFVVGPVYWADSQFKEQFIVDNKGNVTAKGDGRIDGKLTTGGTVNGRSMAVDGAKLDLISFNAKEVGVTSGFVINGTDLTPLLPSGFAQVRIIVSPGAVGPFPLSFITTNFSFFCQVLSTGHLQMEWQFGSSIIAGWAHYLAIGIT
jgi:hypothetical protein